MKHVMLMDPISLINPKKDTSLAILLATQSRGCENYLLGPEDIWLQDGVVWGRVQSVKVFNDFENWYELGDITELELRDLDVLWMRKDPPFDMNFLYLTYLLEQAEAQGLFVVNKPKSLRDANEKLFAAWFSHCCPKTLVTSKANKIFEFLLQVDEAVIKPLDSMGGQGIFRLKDSDHNKSAIIESSTFCGKRKVMLQEFIPEITNGDKRILMINGEPVPYALARIPAKNDFRGNLAAGATGEGRPLTERDKWICKQVGPTLKEKGLFFVGLDVIGDYLTEINVTSPTCVRELNQQFGLDIAGDLVDVVLSVL